MNYLHVQVQVLVPSPRDYPAPLGLVVFDIPAFILSICHNCGYYEDRPQVWVWDAPNIKSCSAWAFDGSTPFRRGGKFEILDDGIFRIVYHLGGATYTTINLKVSDLLTVDLMSDRTIYRKHLKLGADFGWNIRRHMKRNERKLIDMLGGLNSEKPEEPEYSAYFPWLAEEDEDDDNDDDDDDDDDGDGDGDD